MKNSNLPILFIFSLLLLHSCMVFDSEEELDYLDDIFLSERTQMSTDETNNHSIDASDLKSGTVSARNIKGFFKLSSGPVPVGYTIKLTVNGIGNVSHMGKTRLIMNKVTTTNSNPWNANASIVITRANGEELHFSYNDCLIDLTQTPQFDFKAECVVTGGTGRYKNASGTIVYHEVFNWSESTGFLNISGNIEYR